jgi:hypothetical protein
MVRPASGLAVAATQFFLIIHRRNSPIRLARSQDTWTFDLEEVCSPRVLPRSTHQPKSALTRISSWKTAETSVKAWVNMRGRAPRQ